MLRRTFLQLNPAQLKRDIVGCQDRLLEFSANKPDNPKEVSVPSDHPLRRQIVSPMHHSRTSLVRQPI